ncbi:MAG: riboflavin synthase [Planctomycetota bacterium]|nr:riboflavin synthase [Planctomycetota bacterium]
MFTGIVERSSKILKLTTTPQGRRLTVSSRPETSTSGDLTPWGDLVAGESISVDGACLTLLPAAEELQFDVVEETLRRTVLGSRGVDSIVNLERALKVGDRLGGHYVTGHIDTLGTIRSIPSAGEICWVIEHDRSSRFRTVEKGSVTVDGVSLTVASSSDDSFLVALIPHTLAVTSLGQRVVGDVVNLEMDHFGRWVDELHRDRQGESS